MIGRRAKKRTKQREQNKKLYDEHQGALELLDKHGDLLKMLGNNLELMKMSAILIDSNSPTQVQRMYFNNTPDGKNGFVSMMVMGVYITLDMESFIKEYNKGINTDTKGPNNG